MNRFKQIIYEVKEQKNITREHFQIFDGDNLGIRGRAVVSACP